MIKFLIVISCLLYDGESTPSGGCGPGSFRCRDGTCIAKTLSCNNNKDCPNGEDEQGCKAPGTPSKTNATSCDSSQFECNDGTCIWKSWVCDGYRDCPYGEDELYCSTWTPTSTATSTWPYTTPTWPYTTPTWPYTTPTWPYTTPTWPSTTPTWPYTTTSPYPTRTTRYTYPTTSPYYTTTTPYPTRTTTWPYPTSKPYYTTTTPYPTRTTTRPYPTTTPYYTTTTPYPTRTTTTLPYPTTSPYPAPCEYPYDSLADRCVFVDPVLHATWDEARYICGRAGGGDLVILDSMDFYSELVQYMKINGLTRHSYWVGGRGVSYQSKWEWSSGSDVHMGTPLWALNGSSIGQYEQEPVDFHKSLENCGYLDFERFHYMDDDDCNEIKAAICQLPTWKVSLPDAPAIAQGEPVRVPATDEISPDNDNEPVQTAEVPQESPHDEPVQDPETLKESSYGEQDQGKSNKLPAAPGTPDNDPIQTAEVPQESPRDEPVQDPETLTESSHGKSRLLPAALEASPPGDDPDRTGRDSGSSGSSPGNEAANRAWCDYPYDLVGGRCIVIDPVLSATWEEARYLCGRTGGGDLVVLDSMNFYKDIIDYMKDNGLNHHDYWVGGMGSISGRRWRWVSGSTVLDGTPLWALFGTDYDGYEQEPTYFEESLSNCGYLDRERFHFMDDTDCQGVKAAICQIPTWTQGAAIEKGVPKVQKIDEERAKELQEIAKAPYPSGARLSG